MAARKNHCSYILLLGRRGIDFHIFVHLLGVALRDKERTLRLQLQIPTQKKYYFSYILLLNRLGNDIQVFELIMHLHLLVVTLLDLLLLLVLTLLALLLLGPLLILGQNCI